LPGAEGRRPRGRCDHRHRRPPDQIQHRSAQRHRVPAGRRRGQHRSAARWPARAPPRDPRRHAGRRQSGQGRTRVAGASRSRTLTLSPPMNICVLGGTGFVGTELVTRLVGQGHWVRVPTRNAGHGQHLRVLSTIELVAANVHDPRTLGQLLAGMDAVINLIGISNPSGRATFRSVHAELATKLVTAARLTRVRRLLQMSALGADAEHGPSRYLRSKGEAEAHIRAAVPRLDFTIFRPSVIFGPRDSLTNRFAALLRLAGGFLPLVRSQARFAPVHVGNVAEALVRTLDDRGSFGETYELCGPQVMTLEQIVRMTAAVAQLPCHIL